MGVRSWELGIGDRSTDQADCLDADARQIALTPVAAKSTAAKSTVRRDVRIARHWLKPAAGTGAHRRSARGCVLDDRDGAQDVLGWSCRGEDRTQGGNRADERKTS